MKRSEYISREAARPDAFCEGVSCQDCPFCKDPVQGGCRIDDFVKSIPAADVVEVRHGKWNRDGRCDQCGEHAPFWSMATTYHLSNYCPGCGAKMDGGQNDE